MSNDNDLVTFPRDDRGRFEPSVPTPEPASTGEAALALVIAAAIGAGIKSAWDWFKERD